MSATARTVYWHVTGTVQGVGFRWFVSRQARAIGVEGWVRNLDSGKVAVLARGTDAQLEELRTVVGRGPPGAMVDQILELEPPAGVPPAIPFSIVS